MLLQPLLQLSTPALLRLYYRKMMKSLLALENLASLTALSTFQMKRRVLKSRRGRRGVRGRSGRRRRRRNPAQGLPHKLSARGVPHLLLGLLCMCRVCLEKLIKVSTCLYCNKYQCTEWVNIATDRCHSHSAPFPRVAYPFYYPVISNFDPSQAG